MLVRVEYCADIVNCLDCVYCDVYRDMGASWHICCAPQWLCLSCTSSPCWYPS